MPWNDSTLKKVGQGEPIPQHFSDKADDFEPTKGEDGSLFVKVQNNIQLVGSFVEDYWEYNNQPSFTKTCDSEMNGISIANDGVNNLTFVVNSITRTVYPGETYNATFKQPFTQVTINATDLYRAEVLS